MTLVGIAAAALYARTRCRLSPPTSAVRRAFPPMHPAPARHYMQAHRGEGGGVLGERGSETEARNREGRDIPQILFTPWRDDAMMLVILMIYGIIYWPG